MMHKLIEVFSRLLVWLKLPVILSFVGAVLLVQPTLAQDKTMVTEEKKVSIVVSIKPLKLLMSALLGERVNVSQLIPDGLTPHDFQLKPSDLIKLKAADLVLWLGPHAESYLVKLMQQHALAQIDVTRVEGITLLPYRSLDKWLTVSDHHAHDQHGQGEGHHHKGHSDIHLWLSLENNKVIAKAVVEYFRRQHLWTDKSLETKQLQFFNQIQQLQQDAEKALGKGQHQVLVYHDAFQYLEQTFGLRTVGAVVADPGMGVGIKRLLLLNQLVETEQIRCVLTTPQTNEKIISNIFRQNPYRTASIDVLGAQPGTENFKQYWQLMINAVEGCIR